MTEKDNTRTWKIEPPQNFTKVTIKTISFYANKPVQMTDTTELFKYIDRTVEGASTIITKRNFIKALMSIYPEIVLYNAEIISDLTWNLTYDEYCSVIGKIVIKYKDILFDKNTLLDIKKEENTDENETSEAEWLEEDLVPNPFDNLKL